MYVRILLALILIGSSLTAPAQFVTITEAYEVSVSDLRMPRSTGGSVTFRRCADCETQTLPVTSRTRYLLNDRDVELAEFRESITGAGAATATVMHHLESNTVTAVMIRF